MFFSYVSLAHVSTYHCGKGCVEISAQPRHHLVLACTRLTAASTAFGKRFSLSPQPQPHMNPKTKISSHADISICEVLNNSASLNATTDNFKRKENPLNSDDKHFRRCKLIFCDRSAYSASSSVRHNYAFLIMTAISKVFLNTHKRLFCGSQLTWHPFIFRNI